jgi:predicted outer membrane protein
MRSLWMLAAGLFLVACQSDGERGEAVRQERGMPPGTSRVQIEHPGPGADETNVARVLTATRVLAQGGVDAGKLAQQRASSPEVKDYATRAVAEYQANLDALSDVAKAKKIDLGADAVQNDPLLRAQRDTVKDGVDHLRGLSGTAFDAAYMLGERPVQALLSNLALEAPLVSRDPEVGNVLRTMSQQVKDRTTKALTILPKACGGDRAGWGGSG